MSLEGGTSGSDDATPGSPEGASRDELVSDIDAELDEGHVPNRVFADQAVYELEMETIFRNQWQLLAHESEIPDEGDYVKRYLGDDSFIVVRDEDGDVNVFANTCRHQGMQVCRAERGNSSHFRCTYHGWTYNNDGELVGIPYHDHCYPDTDMREERGGLLSPHYDTYNGLIFAAIDPDVESLEEWLGEGKWYLDIYFGRTPGGVEVRGPTKQVVNTNWKPGVINSMSDAYHLATTHKSAIEAGVLHYEDIQDFGPKATRAYQVGAGPTATRFVVMDEPFPFYDETVKEHFREHLPPEQRKLVFEEGIIPLNGGVFPNMTVLTEIGAVPEEDGETISFNYMRTFRPLGPNKSEVLTWFFMEKETPDDVLEKAYKAYTFSFGPSGTITQDDGVNWRGITEAGRGESSQQRLSYEMGQVPWADWPGPGNVYKTGFGEDNARYFFERYVDAMREP